MIVNEGQSLLWSHRLIAWHEHAQCIFLSANSQLSFASIKFRVKYNVDSDGLYKSICFYGQLLHLKSFLKYFKKCWFCMYWRLRALHARIAYESLESTSVDDSAVYEWKIRRKDWSFLVQKFNPYTSTFISRSWNPNNAFVFWWYWWRTN